MDCEEKEIHPPQMQGREVRKLMKFKLYGLFAPVTSRTVGRTLVMCSRGHLSCEICSTLHSTALSLNGPFPLTLLSFTLSCMSRSIGMTIGILEIRGLLCWLTWRRDLTVRGQRSYCDMNVSCGTRSLWRVENMWKQGLEFMEPEAGLWRFFPNLTAW